MNHIFESCAGANKKERTQHRRLLKNNNKNNNNSKQQTCVFCARSRKKQRKEEEEEERNGICFEERETEFLYSMKEVKTTRKKNSNKSVNNLEYTIHTVLKLEGTAERTEKARVHVSTLCYLLIDEHTHTRKGLDRPKVDEMVDASFFCCPPRRRRRRSHNFHCHHQCDHCAVCHPYNGLV